MNPKPARTFVVVLFATGFVALLAWNATVMANSVIDSWNMKQGFIGGALFMLLIDVLLIGMIVFASIAGAMKRKNGKSNKSAQHNAGSRPSSGDSPASASPSAPAPRG